MCNHKYCTGQRCGRLPFSIDEVSAFYPRFMMMSYGLPPHTATFIANLHLTALCPLPSFKSSLPYLGVVKTALGNYQRQFNQSFMPQESPPHYKQPSTSPRSSSPKENVSRSTSADSVSMLSSEELRTASTSSQNSNSGKHDDSDQSSQNEGSSITGRCGPTLTRKRSCRQNRVILDLIEKLRVEEQQQQERLRSGLFQ